MLRNIFELNQSLHLMYVAGYVVRPASRTKEGQRSLARLFLKGNALRSCGMWSMRRVSSNYLLTHAC